MVQPWRETQNFVTEANDTTGKVEVNRIYKLRIREQSGKFASLVRGLAWPWSATDAARMYEQDEEYMDEGEDGDEISNEIWQEVSP